METGIPKDLQKQVKHGGSQYQMILLGVIGIVGVMTVLQQRGSQILLGGGNFQLGRPHSASGAELFATCLSAGVQGYISSTDTSLEGQPIEIHLAVTQTQCVDECEKISASCHGFSYHERDRVCYLQTQVSRSLAAQGFSGWVNCKTVFRVAQEKVNHPKSASVGKSGLELVMRQGKYLGPVQLCDYTDAQITEILAMEHSCQPYTKNTFVGDAWTTMKKAEEKATKRVECAIKCSYNMRPCPHGLCLLPFYFRKGTTDLSVAHLLLEEKVPEGLDDMRFNSILDAGANIGLNAAVLATLNPNATIVSVEPSTGNFEMLRLNTARASNVVRVKAGLWPRVANLALVEGHRAKYGSEWAYEVLEYAQMAAGQKAIETLVGVSVPFLMQSTGLDRFELLKMDIEGSEMDVLKVNRDADLSWIDKASVFVCELHEDMRSGAKASVQATFDTEDWWLVEQSKAEVYFARPEIAAKHFNVTSKPHVKLR